MKIVGVDPGISGAIAWYDGEHLMVFDFPVSKSKGRGNEIMWPLLVDQFDVMIGAIDHAFIELVGPRPQEGRGTVFKFGVACGGVRALLATRYVPVTMVTPAKWKADMACTADKEYSRTRACELFPKYATAFFSRKMDNNRAEAALIAYYGRKLLMQEINLGA